LIFFGLLSSAYIQTQIAQRFTKSFINKTQQQISFQEVHLRWNGALEFKDFYLEDHHKDTLLYVRTLTTSLLGYENIQNNLSLSNVLAEGVSFHLKKYKGEKTHSLKILLDKLKKDKRDREKNSLHISSLAIEKFDFAYIDQNIPQNKIELNPLRVKANSFFLEGETFQVELEKLEGEINAPKRKQITSSAWVSYQPGQLLLEDWMLASDSSYINGRLLLTGTDDSFENFNSNGEIRLEVFESQWDFASLFPEQTNLKEIPPMDAVFEVEGGLSSFDVKNIIASSPLIDFRGQISTQNDLNQGVMSWEVMMDSLHIHTKEIQSLSIFPDRVKKQITQLSEFKLRGMGTFVSDSIVLDINANNSWGDVVLNTRLGKGFFDKKISNQRFSVNAKVKNLKSNRFILTQLPYELEGEITAQGDLSNRQAPVLSWKVKKGKLNTINTSIEGITLEGRLEEKELRNTLSILSEPIELKSDLLFNYADSIPIFTLLANIQKWDLNTVGLKLGTGKRIFKGVVLSNFKGNHLDHGEGEIKISSASLENEFQTVTLNPISITKRGTKSNTILEIDNTDCISGAAQGEFNISEIRALFQNTFHQVYPFLPQRQVSKNQEVSFKLKIYEKLLDALYPSFSITENITMNGSINTEKLPSQIVLDAPLLRFKEFQFEQLHFQLNTNNPLYNTFFSVDHFSHPKFKGKTFNLISTQVNDTLFFRSEFETSNEQTALYDVNFYHTREKDGTSHFGIKKSVLPIGKDTWVINPKNTAQQKISYLPNQEQIELTVLTAVSGNQSMAFSGSYFSPEKFSFKINLKKLLLERLLPTLPEFQIAGETEFNALINRSETDNELNISAIVQSLKINEKLLGDLLLVSKGNTALNTYAANLNLSENNEKRVELKGFWKGLEAPNLNFNVSLIDLDLSFLSPLGRKALNKIRGSVNGEFNLWGPLDALQQDGSLTWTEGGFAVPYLNIDYDVAPSKVILNKQSFLFDSLIIRDPYAGTQAEINGSFSHTNFSNWFANLDITSERMLLLNTPQEPESLFFGSGYLNGSVRLEGPTKELNISIQGATEEGTAIKIPWSESYGLSDTSFVKYIDKNKRSQISTQSEFNSLQEVKGLELDFELDVNNKATVEIVIDQETGSYLSGSGAGNLFMEVNTKGKFNMWGDFITYDGIYNFKNLGVIDKKFDVKPGGTIVWEGNPLEAQMNLEAVYEVPGGANPALLLDNPNFNKSIPTEVLIRLQGNLLKPDDPIFEIDFPNTSGTVASEINYRLADPQRSQLQAISLLSQGIFINEVSVSMQGITNNLYQKASDIISDLIGEENDKLKVGIDYLQGDKSALLDIATEDRLGFTLSTKISDKILLNGKIGVPVGGVEQTLIVGNVQIDFILNDEGTLRAKVFNKENEFRYIGDELGYTQGVGLSYEVDFSTFKELINKITSQNTGSKSQNLNNQDTNIVPLVEFIQKN